MGNKRFSQTRRPTQARAVCERLKCYAHGYNSILHDFVDAESRLWWSVLEESWVDTAYLGSKLARASFARDSLDWFMSDNCEGVLAALGLDPDYTRMILRRWLRAAGIQEVRS
jgi:hypothetical protein